MFKRIICISFCFWAFTITGLFGFQTFQVTDQKLSFTIKDQSTPLFGSIDDYKFQVNYGHNLIKDLTLNLSIKSPSIRLKYGNNKTLGEMWDDKVKSLPGSMLFGKENQFRNWFLDVNEYPEMTFSSKEIYIDENNGQLKVVGDWEMHGDREEVEIQLNLISTNFSDAENKIMLYGTFEPTELISKIQKVSDYFKVGKQLVMMTGKFTVNPSEFDHMDNWELLSNPWEFNFFIEATDQTLLSKD